MLFDLQSSGRRRVVRVVFGGLAAIFAISFVFFGVGSGISGFGGDGGGLLDALGIGGGSGTNTGFEDEISAQEKLLEANPQDVAALKQLVALHYQAGNQLVDADTGSLNTDGEEQMQKGGEAWNRYVKANGGKVDSGTATIAFQLFYSLAADSLGEAQQATSTTEVLDKAAAATANWKAAAQAQLLAAEQRPDSATYVRVAQLFYLAGDTKSGDEAAAKARAAAKPSEQKQVDAQLKQAETQGTQINDAIAKIQKQDQQQQQQLGGDQGNPLENLGGGALGGGGGLGGGGTTLTP
jgi:hypothetical protein